MDLTIMFLFISIVFFLFNNEIRCEDADVPLLRHKRSEVCYGSLGCFSDAYPFTSKNWPPNFLPESPEKLRTSYRLFTRDTTPNYQLLNATSIDQLSVTWTQLKTRPTKIVIHAFLDNFDLYGYYPNFVKQMLIAGDFNVIFVDWSEGNRPPYIHTIANTRVVGAQVAEMVKAVQTTASINLSDIHIIGHSVGAHIAGYAGERLPGLGRISGLDPAGAFFQDADRRVRLDETDAVFVDVVHTDAAGVLKGGTGSKTLSGNIDFFANLGHNQPGCEKNIFKSVNILLHLDFKAVGSDIVLCSHNRAMLLFIESINSECPFMALPCENEEDFTNNQCRSCTEYGCQRFGYHAKMIERTPGYPVTYFFTTSDKPQYCQYHYMVTVKVAEQGTQVKGRLDLVIEGDNQLLHRVSLTNNSITLEPGNSYDFKAMLPTDIGEVQSVTISWKYATTFASFFFMNIFDKSSMNLYVEEVTVYRVEADVGAKFCVESQEIQSGSELKATTKC